MAFPNDFRPTHQRRAARRKHGETDQATLEAQPVEVAIAGRMMLKRVMGKASFATVQDGSGQIQFYVTRDKVGEEVYAAFRHWDLGDIISARGELFRTNKGELSVQVRELRLLSKALRPLPDKFHGLADQETEVPPALRRPDRLAGDARRFPGAYKRHRVAAPPYGRRRLHGGGNADAASDSGRRRGQAVHYAPQRAGHADVPAHRAELYLQAA